MTHFPCAVSSDLNRYDRDMSERDKRDLALERLQSEEYASMDMPEDMMQMVAENMTPMAELAAWKAYRAGDQAELGRIITHWIDAVRENAANARAAKRMEQLERNEYKGE